MLLVAALFWGLFLPWGWRFSVDALRTVGAPASNAFLGVPGAAWIGQICILYAFSALVKNGSQWREEGTAIAYVLQAGQYNTALAHLALGAPPEVARPHLRGAGPRGALPAPCCSPGARACCGP